MASVFAHLAIGATGTQVFKTTGLIKPQAKVYWLAMVSSAMPDLDVIAFHFGIPYSHWLGHRGFSHSFLFALFWTIIISLLFLKKEWQTRKEGVMTSLLIFLMTASHGVIDAMTNGGRGIGFFIPWTDERYFFPFRPIQVSPLGVENFFSTWGLRVIQSELVWLFFPCFIVLVFCRLIDKTTS